MSQQNVSVVRMIYEALARGDRASLFRHADPAIRCYDRPIRPDASVYEGHDGWAKFMETDLEAFENVSYEPLRFVETGPYVVVPIRQTGRGKRSALDVEESIVNVWKLRAGRCIEMRVYSTMGEALEAVGMLE